MAGAGVKLFQSGAILTADELNQYFMDQTVCVFLNEDVRDASFGGSNEPTLSEGRVCYIINSTRGQAGKVIQYYNGSTWVDSAQFTTPDLSITNAKVSATAAIALSKLASGTSGQIIVANSSGVPTYVTLSGDATISNAGVISIGANNVALGTDTTGNYVATVAGTANQVTVAGSGSETAAVSLSLPQDIHTGASPQFAALSATGAISGASASVSGAFTGASASVSGAIAGASASVSGSIAGASADILGNVVYHIATASVASGGSLSTAEDGKLVELTGNNATLTVPGTGWTIGSQLTVMQMGTGSASITFTGATDVKATPRVSVSVVALRTQYSTATIINRGTSDWYVIGDLKS